MDSMSKKHKFGGVWTRKKLAVLNEYLQFYATALKNQPFKLHYADAFAGTGSHNPKEEDDQCLLIPYEDFEGSVRTALNVEGFHEYHFNDLDPEHVKALEEIQAGNPNKSIKVYKKDANEFVPFFCSKMQWNDRAVLFLDPYSTQLDWQTLQFIKKSKKIDLWLLFPLSVILRMTPKDGAKVKAEWKATLDRLLGTNDWEKALYKEKENPIIQDLFDDGQSTSVIERVNSKELEKWVTSRLKEVFPYVAEPIELKSNGSPLFLFYFAVSNDNEKAQNLAYRATKSIVKKNLSD